jgi:hypothetical protein
MPASWNQIASWLKQIDHLRQVPRRGRLSPQDARQPYDDLKSGRVKPIDGEEAFWTLREKSERRRSGG